MNEHTNNPMQKYDDAVLDAQQEVRNYRTALRYLRHSKLAREAARLGYVNFANQVLEGLRRGINC